MPWTPQKQDENGYYHYLHCQKCEVTYNCFVPHEEGSWDKPLRRDTIILTCPKCSDDWENSLSSGISWNFYKYEHDRIKKYSEEKGY